MDGLLAAPLSTFCTLLVLLPDCYLQDSILAFDPGIEIEAQAETELQRGCRSRGIQFEPQL